MHRPPGSTLFPYTTLFRSGDAARVFMKLDPTFEFAELPLEVCVGSERRILYRGRQRVADYDVFVEHGFYLGKIGRASCRERVDSSAGEESCRDNRSKQART